MSERFTPRRHTTLPQVLCQALCRLLPSLTAGLLLLSGGPPELAAQSDTTRGDSLEVPTTPVTTTPRVPLSPLTDPFPYALYDHTVEFDSTTGEVRLYEELLGTPYGVPRTLTLEEYIRRRQEEARRRMWEEEAREYVMYGPEKSDTLSSGALLDSLLSGGSPSFTIPLPQNPITTLFGPPTIDINVNSFAWVSRFRRLARDHERLAGVFASMHLVAFVSLMLNRLAPMAPSA